MSTWKTQSKRWNESKYSILSDCCPCSIDVWMLFVRCNYWRSTKKKTEVVKPKSQKEAKRKSKAKTQKSPRKGIRRSLVLPIATCKVNSCHAYTYIHDCGCVIAFVLWYRRKDHSWSGARYHWWRVQRASDWRGVLASKNDRTSSECSRSSKKSTVWCCEKTICVLISSKSLARAHENFQKFLCCKCDAHFFLSVHQPYVFVGSFKVFTITNIIHL